jgi:hypothetical protein
VTAENGSETRLIRPLGRVAWRAHPPGSPADPIRDARVTRRLCGVVLPCCDDRPVGGGGGCRACARGPAVGVIAAGFRCGGGCRLPAGAGAGAAGCGSRRIGYGP